MERFYSLMREKENVKKKIKLKIDPTKEIHLQMRAIAHHNNSSSLDLIPYILTDNDNFQYKNEHWVHVRNAFLQPEYLKLFFSHQN